MEILKDLRPNIALVENGQRDAFTEDVNKALAAGMNDHIPKQIDY